MYIFNFKKFTSWVGKIPGYISTWVACDLGTQESITFTFLNKLNRVWIITILRLTNEFMQCDTVTVYAKALTLQCGLRIYKNGVLNFIILCMQKSHTVWITIFTFIKMFTVS